ncbi:hypothetical protein ACHAXT_004862 [Thalassiosira profunda]
MGTDRHKSSKAASITRPSPPRRLIASPKYPRSDGGVAARRGGAASEWQTRQGLAENTPSTPARGYAVMDDDDGPYFGREIQLRDVPTCRSRGRTGALRTREVHISCPRVITVHPLPSSRPTAPALNYLGDSDAVAVSQDDEHDCAAVSQEEVVPSSTSSLNNGDTPPNPGAGHKSGTDASTSARRRSLRLQASAIDEDAGEPNAVTEELDIDMIEEDGLSSKPSSRRRSLRILARRLDSSEESDDAPAVVDEAKKRKAKKGAVAKRCPPSGAALERPKSPADPAEMMDEDDPIAASVSFESYEIGMTENGHGALVHALEKIAFDIVVGPSNFANVSKRKSPGRSKKRGHRAETSVLAMLDSEAAVPFAKENDVTASGRKARRKARRDTFDLSRKKRGLASAAKRMDNLNVFLDDAVPGEDEGADYLTPKNGTEVDVNALVGEMSRSSDDEPGTGLEPCKEEAVLDGAELAVVKSNLQHLTSVGIEEKMRLLFPEKMGQLYNHPCVSARVFAAMSIVYEDQANLTPLMPFLHSLVDAEIISLKSKEESEVCFLNKKVHFSGFDYSSTTTVVGDVVGQGGGDLRPSIEALESILQHALKLPRPAHFLTVAIQCLQCMATCRDASQACVGTMLGWYPSARFEKALLHYVDEMRDIKRYVTAPNNLRVGDDHLGIRYRLNDFIGRSVRFHLRELLNSIPDAVVDLNCKDCEERWGRAVDDGSFSSILNFALEKMHELMTCLPAIFEYGVDTMPEFFAREAFGKVFSVSRDDLKRMDKSTYESLALDIVEARSFLFGARACKFVLDLLSVPGVERHIDAAGGWGTVEAFCSTFYNLKLYEGSENEHFVQLREDVDGRFQETVGKCEYEIRKLRRRFNFKTQSPFVNNLKLHLAGEKKEYFPLPQVNEFS